MGRSLHAAIEQVKDNRKRGCSMRSKLIQRCTNAARPEGVSDKHIDSARNSCHTLLARLLNDSSHIGVHGMVAGLAGLEHHVGGAPLNSRHGLRSGLGASLKGTSLGDCICP